MTYIMPDYSGINRQTVIESTSQEAIMNSKFEGYREVAALDVSDPKVEEVEKVEDKPKIDMEIFEDKITGDYLGAIHIPVIGTSEPIYKSEGDYYLEHSYKKEYNKVGEVYLDDRTGTDLTGNGILLNGHAVPNGTKFGSFKKLLDVEEQPLVHLYNHSTQSVVTYKMLFVSLIDGANAGIVMEFGSMLHRHQYYRNLYETSIKKWQAPTEGGEYLLLNSCAYIIDDGRYVVIAERVE